MVGRRCAARLDADRAALRLDLHGELGEVRADLVIVRADIGDAQVLVLGQRRRNPRSEPGMPASLAACSATAIAAALDGDTAMPSTFLATRSCTIVHLLVAAAMLAGADIHALRGAV